MPPMWIGIHTGLAHPNIPAVSNTVKNLEQVVVGGAPDELDAHHAIVVARREPQRTSRIRQPRARVRVTAARPQ
jgi:hypothetical protein